MIKKKENSWEPETNLQKENKMKANQIILFLCLTIFTFGLSEAQVDTLVCKKINIISSAVVHSNLVVGSQIYPLYKFRFNNMEFSCTIKADSTIHTIYINDSQYVTEEGIKLNASLMDVLSNVGLNNTIHISPKLNLIYVELMNGWIVGFYDKQILSKMPYIEVYYDGKGVLRNKKSGKKTFLKGLKSLQAITIFKKCGEGVF